MNIKIDRREFPNATQKGTQRIVDLFQESHPEDIQIAFHVLANDDYTLMIALNRMISEALFITTMRLREIFNEVVEESDGKTH